MTALTYGDLASKSYGDLSSLDYSFENSGGSGITAADIAAIAQAVWEYVTRTLTSSGSGGATAQEVWSYASRTLTGEVSLTSAYNAAKTAAQAGDAMTLTAAYNAAKTAAKAGDAMNLTAAYDAAKTAAKPGDAMTLTNAYDAAKSAAASSSISGIADLIEKVFALIARWTVSGNTLTAYDSQGETLGTFTLTRNTSGEITSISEAEEVET